MYSPILGPFLLLSILNTLRMIIVALDAGISQNERVDALLERLLSAKLKRRKRYQVHPWESRARWGFTDFCWALGNVVAFVNLG